MLCWLGWVTGSTHVIVGDAVDVLSTWFSASTLFTEVCCNHSNDTQVGLDGTLVNINNSQQNVQ